MTHVITHSGAQQGVAGYIARLRKAWADYRLYRETLVELRALSDRDLADLGISRHALTDIARDAVYSA